MLLYLSWRRTASSYVTDVFSDYCKAVGLNYIYAVGNFNSVVDNIHTGCSFGTPTGTIHPDDLQKSNADIVQVDRNNEYFFNQLTHYKISFKSFMVIRDPRDIIISDYFSIRYSHSVNYWIKQLRPILNSVTKEEGITILLSYYIPRFAEIRRLLANENIMKIHFTDLVDDSFTTYKKIFNYDNLYFDEKVMKTMLDKHSFENIAKRQRGIEDIHKHYRIGVSGSWKTHFSPQNISLFNTMYSDFMKELISC